MKPIVKASLAVCLAAVAGAAHASIVTFATAASTAGPQASAAAYRDVVNAAFAAPGSHTATLALFDHASSQIVFGGAYSDIAYRATVNFGVSAADAGTWALRAGVDYGHGGAVFLDGVALGFKSSDMWWGASYADPAQSFQFNALSLAAGNHTLQLFGLEGCCDGWQQAQFSIRGGEFRTFGAQDGLAAVSPSIGAAVVPEPGSLGLAGAAFGGMALAGARRRRRGTALWAQPVR